MTGPVSTAPNRDVAYTVLPNGVRVISEFMPHVRSASVGVWIATGSRRETAGENGISHFIEHMLFKGTRNRSAEQIAISVDSIGGNLDAFTSRELVSYDAKALDDHLPVAFDILSDLVLNPLFRAEDIEKEKGVIFEEIKMEADNPEYLVHEIFCGNFWKGHALGKPILGTRDTIRKFRREDIEQYYRRFYIPSNIVLSAAGRVEHARLVDLAAERFDALAPNGTVPPDTAPATQAKVILRSKKSLEQVHVCLGVPSFPLPHERRFGTYVLNTILGGSMSSRLFQNIRERQGLVYAVFSELNLYRDSGCLMVYAGTSLESTRKVVASILKEFRELKERPVPEEELERAKAHLKGSLMLGLESTSSRMANLARQEIFFGRFFTMDELIRSIENVTAEEITGIAREFFDADGVALTVLGRLNGLAIEREELAC